MRYTYNPAPPSARPCKSVQIYSVKVGQLIGLCWPLHVFGMVAVRDLVDKNRNLVFYRTKDNCQTLTEMDPYVVLTGPTRAVVMEDDMIRDVYLKIKGDTENEDKYFSYFSAATLPLSPGFSVNPISRSFDTKYGTLEVAADYVMSSVEATIFVRVVDGSWPHGFHGHFAAQTTSQQGINVDGVPKVVLIDFGAGKVPIDGFGFMNLSRHVVSVEVDAGLKVYFMAWRDDKSFEACQDDNEVVKGELLLEPEKAGRSYASLRLGSCVMQVLVAWSLVLPEPQPDVPE